MPHDINYGRVPEHMREGIRDYIEKGRRPGDFLYAVLTNNLCGAFHKADETNLRNLHTWVNFLHWEVPEPLWGSEKAVEAWIERHQNKNDPDAAE